MFQIEDMDQIMYSSQSIGADGTFIGGKPKCPEDFSVVKLTASKDGEMWGGMLQMPHGLDVATASKATNRGYSIVLNKVDARWHEIHRAAEALENVIGQRVQANLYLSPPVSQGFETHFDYMDVLVVQMHGTKNWRVFETPFIRAPRSNQKFKPTHAQLKARTYMNVFLSPGDILYIPAGYLHDAHNKDMSNPSVHLSFGFETDVAFRWEGLIHHAIHAYFQNEIFSLTNNVSIDSNQQHSVRMLCHAVVSLLSTRRTKDGLFGKPVPSLHRGFLGPELGRESSSSSSSTAENRSELEEVTFQTLMSNKLWKEHWNTIVELLQSKHVTVDDALAYWHPSQNEELVQWSWRSGRQAGSEVDDKSNGGPPPQYSAASALAKEMMTDLDLRELLLFIVSNKVNMNNALKAMELEFARRSEQTNQLRNETLARHIERRAELYSDVVEL